MESGASGKRRWSCPSTAKRARPTGWPVAGWMTRGPSASSPSSVSRSAASRTGMPMAESFREAIWFSRSRGILPMMVCSPSDIAASDRVAEKRPSSRAVGRAATRAQDRAGARSGASRGTGGRAAPGPQRDHRLAQRLERAPAGVAGLGAQLLLDAEQLVVLGDAVGAGGRAGLDLAAVAGHGQVGDGGVLGLARAVAHHAGVPGAVGHADGLEGLGERPDLVHLDQ